MVPTPGRSAVQLHKHVEDVAPQQPADLLLQSVDEIGPQVQHVDLRALAPAQPPGEQPDLAPSGCTRQARSAPGEL